MDSPTPHARHDVAFVVLATQPVGQLMHPEVELEPNFPRGQGICVVGPEFSKPASTVRHSLWAGLFWYSPGVVQSLQLSGLTCPVSAENLPGGQSLHPVSACTPFAEEYVPAEQFLQVDSLEAPVLLLHFPALHKAHSVLS